MKLTIHAVVFHGSSHALCLLLFQEDKKSVHIDVLNNGSGRREGKGEEGKEGEGEKEEGQEG